MQRSFLGGVATAAMIGLFACGGSKSSDKTSATSGSGGSTSTGMGGSAGTGTGGQCPAPATTAKCIDGGWCWDEPTPFGGALEAIAGSDDASTILAVGEDGASFVFACGAWTPVDTGVIVSLRGVFVPEPNFGLAVGDGGTALEWNGVAWSTLDTGTNANLTAVWGSAKDDIWVGGEADALGTALFHFDGSSWTRATFATSTDTIDIFALAGTSKTDVVAVGALGAGDMDQDDASLHFDGTSWTELPSSHGYPDFGPFVGAVASNDGSLYALFGGFNTSQVFRFGGSDWTSVYEAENGGELHALFRDANGDAAVFDAPPDMTAHLLAAPSWNAASDTFAAAPSAAWAAPNGSAFGAGAATLLLERGANAAWSQVAGVEPSAFPGFLAGSSASDLWLVGTNGAFHRGASGWTSIPSLGGYETIYEGAIDASGKPYLLGLDGSIEHFDGTNWTKISPPPSSLVNANDADGIAANAPDDVFMLFNSEDALLHYDGSSWSYAASNCQDLADPSTSSSFESGTLRRAPDGKAWVVNDLGALAFDASQGTCFFVTTASGQEFMDDALVDVAWTPDGAPWFITFSGDVYTQEGTALVMKTSVAANLDPSMSSSPTLASASDGTILITSSFEDGTIAVFALDPNTLQTTQPVDAPAGSGEVWAEDAAHILAILNGGGVLGHGFVNP